MGNGHSDALPDNCMGHVIFQFCGERLIASYHKPALFAFELNGVLGRKACDWM